MKTYKTIERQYKEKVLDYVTCDICGRKSGVEHGTGHWGAKWGDIGETTMSSKTGWACRDDGGSATTLSFDVCTTCFETKLIPLMREKFGAEPTKTETDW